MNNHRFQYSASVFSVIGLLTILDLIIKALPLQLLRDWKYFDKSHKTYFNVESQSHHLIYKGKGIIQI